MANLRNLALLFVVVLSLCITGCRGVWRSSDDYLQLGIPGVSGKKVLRHILFRDGRLNLGINVTPGNVSPDAHNLGVKRTSRIWKVSDEVLGKVEEGKYYLTSHDECTVEILISGRKNIFVLTHNLRDPEAPAALEKLILELSGLSKW